MSHWLRSESYSVGINRRKILQCIQLWNHPLVNLPKWKGQLFPCIIMMEQWSIFWSPSTQLGYFDTFMILCSNGNIDSDHSFCQTCSIYIYQYRTQNHSYRGILKRRLGNSLCSCNRIRTLAHWAHYHTYLVLYNHNFDKKRSINH